MIQALTFIVCALLLAGICLLWVERDHKEITKATGKHELKRKFHRQGLLWKMGSVLPVVVLFAITFNGWGMLYAFVSFSFFAASYWWYFFDLWLNKARDLDPYYIGKSSTIDVIFQDMAVYYRLSNKQAIQRVKVPLLAIAFLLCIAVIVSC